MRLCLATVVLTACVGSGERPVYRPTPDPGISQPPAGDPHRAARDIWIARCATCHGTAGRGDGPDSRLIRPRPVSFADAAWHTRTPDDQIARIIVDGGVAVGRSPSMPASPDLRGPSAQALVKLIRSFEM